MDCTMREIQHYIGSSREARRKRIILSLSTIMPEAQKGEATHLPRTPLLLDLDKVKWKPANLSGIMLGDILVMWYDDGQDQL